LRAELAGAGVDAHGWTGPDQTLGDGDLLVAVDDGNAAAMAAVDQACRRSGISWLRTAAGERTAEIGPLFNARYTSCHECFAGHRPHPDGTPSPARAAIWAALTATEIVHLLSRVGSTPSTSGCTVFDLDDWTQSAVGAYRRPGCPQCLPTRAPAPPASAHLYEQAVAAPPREWLNLKDHQAHYRPANLSLQRYHKEYLAALRIPLDGEPPAPGPRLNLGTLAVLLRRTAGLREDEPAAASGKVNRWAPTGGNLGSVQAYLLALDVPGLPPGWYFYQRGDHSLARIRAGASEAEASAVCPQLAPHRPAALIALTGALGVVAAKYQDFAYRILCLDAGVALAQLTALADDHAVTTRIADRWDDTAVSRALRIEPADEPVTTVLALDPRNHDDLHH
ncbi:hypothetical protein, partial [Actinoplanes philippinensis]|uniref:hypothetical protein n=1 Tax=Actinoplanes philippinensis TaxID=35752 RepID=UPI0034114533